jgi:hypothetical protein
MGIVGIIVEARAIGVTFAYQLIRIAVAVLRTIFDPWTITAQ